jgi:hypothetical protein
VILRSQTTSLEEKIQEQKLPVAEGKLPHEEEQKPKYFCNHFSCFKGTRDKERGKIEQKIVVKD